MPLQDHRANLEAGARTSALPRPEYPRPQFVRHQWLNLNGVWDFGTDDDNVGLERRWFAATGLPGTIIVPFSMESKRSGIEDRSFRPCVWYLKHFQIPESWAESRILLNFGAVDYRATVWVNGVVAGSHEGGHTPFSCDITGPRQAGDNIVVVRAEDPRTIATFRAASNIGKQSRPDFLCQNYGHLANRLA